MTKILQLIAVAVLTFQSFSLGLPTRNSTVTPSNATIIPRKFDYTFKKGAHNLTLPRGSTGGGEVSLAGRPRLMGEDNLGYMLFSEHNDWGGYVAYCPVYKFNTCYTINMNGHDGASTLLFDTWMYGGDRSMTWYTGWRCDGNWMRWSAKVKPETWVDETLPSRWNDKFHSYYVSDFLTYDAEGFNNPPVPYSHDVCMPHYDYIKYPAHREGY